MIRKNLLLLLFCLFISSCGPIDIFDRDIELSNVEFIVDQKEKFEVGDSVDFTMTFDADFEKFNRYDFAMSIYQNSNPIIDAISAVVLSTFLSVFKIISPDSPLTVPLSKSISSRIVYLAFSYFST